MNLPTVNLNGFESQTKLPKFSKFSLDQPKLDIPGVDHKSVSQFREASAKMKDYSKGIKDIRAGDVDQYAKQAEQEALKRVDLKELEKNQSHLTQYESQLSQIKDQEAMKGMAKEEIQKQAVNHFAGKEEVLKSSMNKMSSLKSRYSELSSLKDTLKRPPNPMKSKPFIERIIPGLTLQFIPSSSNTFVMDANLSAAYRLTGRVNLGTGWTQRLYFNNQNLRQTNPIYGIRNFGEFKLVKGFYARAEMEAINLIMPQPNPGGGPTDSGQRKWEWNGITGLKKDFSLYKSIRGNVQTMYRIWGSHDVTPYSDRLMVRVGFELGMRRKNRRSEE